MAVLPERMEQLDPQDVAGSLVTIENYIRYMGERLEFAISGLSSKAAAMERTKREG